MNQIDFSVGDPILDEEVADVNVAGALSRRLAAVSLHSHGTCVDLKKLTVVDFVSLSFDEIPCPDGLWEEIRSPDELCFSRAFSVDRLLA